MTHPLTPPIDGRTELILHLGFPTHGFRSPRIYNPYFASQGIPAVVVPMACRAHDLAQVLPALFRLDNVRGALITMPLKVAIVSLLDEVSAAVQIAGACNAVKRTDDGRLVGDLFDGKGFVQGALRKGVVLKGARALVVGCGGVGRAIAAALAAEGLAELRLFDAAPSQSEELGQRLKSVYPDLAVAHVAAPDPHGLDMVVNATPLGMYAQDPLPFDIERLSPHTFVGDVVLEPLETPLIRAARAKGCITQVGEDMLYEQIPAYLDYFGLPVATPELLRLGAQR